MIDPRIAAIENLKATYLAIGLATEGSRKIVQDGSVICVSRHDHPVGNFAIVDHCDEASAKDLAIHASAKDTFHLYVTQNAAPNGTVAALTRHGFRSVHVLQLMWVDSEPERNPIKIELIAPESKRTDIANYMADQFFARRGMNIADSVAQATAESGLGLYEIRVGQDRIGVVMLTETEDSIGIYNLVVAPNLRGRGYGKMILREIRKNAGLDGLGVTLQCEKALSAWYRRNDFASCGEISVYVLERR